MVNCKYLKIRNILQFILTNHLRNILQNSLFLPESFLHFFPEFLLFLIREHGAFLLANFSARASTSAEMSKEDFGQDKDAGGLPIGDRLYTQNGWQDGIPQPHDGCWQEKEEGDPERDEEQEFSVEWLM